tara:strand:- start:739 stop:1101 length:363 start_codon:yes stop_codon:yes gene_type:complete
MVCPCDPYFTQEQLQEIEKRKKISKIGKGCKENRLIIRDITQKLINAGALDKTKSTTLENGIYGMIYELKQGKTCCLCEDKIDGERILVKYANPKTKIQEKYPIHKFHLDMSKEIKSIKQ